MVGGGSTKPTATGEGSKPKATIDDAYAYLSAVKNTFHDERDKYDDFIAIMTKFKARKLDRNACIEEVKELLKGHRDLISGFNVFLPKCLEIADRCDYLGQNMK
ncbi:PREDICTED: paired amphipathic helix protein Sin3-like 4 [Camelina sativa]|uniref:Paired amphipathic helix protein Sin3-like 4 n=1 Tax=Camelina sativa TaxID=90675 RepID=A0ABM0WXX9_CAMSA|nr:PREDICTED: paired amphipathic helix protein Sin3-like 4 [Camelina sativa]